MVHCVGWLGLLLSWLAPLPLQGCYAAAGVDDGHQLIWQASAMNLGLSELAWGHQEGKVSPAQALYCRSLKSGELGGLIPQILKLPGSSWSESLDPIQSIRLESNLGDERQSPWQARIGMLGAAYPWLLPVTPSQWINLWLLVLVGCTLIVYLSVHVAGVEGAHLGCSLTLGASYIAMALLQVAAVPLGDFSITLMILINASMCLFGMCVLFGLRCSGATIALLVQLLFGALTYGVLELATALLGSVTVTR